MCNNSLRDSSSSSEEFLLMRCSTNAITTAMHIVKGFNLRCQCMKFGTFAPGVLLNGLGCEGRYTILQIWYEYGMMKLGKICTLDGSSTVANNLSNSASSVSDSTSSCMIYNFTARHCTSVEIMQQFPTYSYWTSSVTGLEIYQRCTQISYCSNVLCVAKK